MKWLLFGDLINIDHIKCIRFKEDKCTISFVFGDGELRIYLKGKDGSADVDVDFEKAKEIIINLIKNPPKQKVVDLAKLFRDNGVWK